MEIIRQSWDRYPSESARHGTVLIGNFDGVHRGHVRLLAAGRALADELRTATVAVTFDPHPLLLLNPARWQAPLTTIARRAELLAPFSRAAADRVVAEELLPHLMG